MAQQILSNSYLLTAACFQSKRWCFSSRSDSLQLMDQDLSQKNLFVPWETTYQVQGAVCKTVSKEQWNQCLSKASPDTIPFLQMSSTATRCDSEKCCCVPQTRMEKSSTTINMPKRPRIVSVYCFLFWHSFKTLIMIHLCPKNGLAYFSRGNQEAH